MKYINLTENDLNLQLFAHFERRQVVTKCWRKQDSQWVIQDIAFIDDWSAEDYQTLLVCLQGTLKRNGMMIGAFNNNELKGFVAMESTLFGGRKAYLDLPCLHVSADFRGQGIGKALFLQAKQWAKKHGAKNLYISAHSSVESQSFYRAMGCVEAEMYLEEHVLAEPCDCQLECEIE